jgi:hypothetical protein
MTDNLHELISTAETLGYLESMTEIHGASSVATHLTERQFNLLNAELWGKFAPLLDESQTSLLTSTNIGNMGEHVSALKHIDKIFNTSGDANNMKALYLGNDGNITGNNTGNAIEIGSYNTDSPFYGIDFKHLSPDQIESLSKDNILDLIYSNKFNDLDKSQIQALNENHLADAASQLEALTIDGDNSQNFNALKQLHEQDYFPLDKMSAEQINSIKAQTTSIEKQLEEQFVTTSTEAAAEAASETLINTLTPVFCVIGAIVLLAIFVHMYSKSQSPSK